MAVVPLRSYRENERQEEVLATVRPVADEYGFDTANLKPCMAFILDGNIGGAGRHDAAFIVAIECRRMGLSESETERVLTQWSAKIDYRTGDALRAITNAFMKAPGGSFKYFPPGVKKREGTRAHAVLADICADVGCPANCAPYSSLVRGPNGNRYDIFERLGWPLSLRRARHTAAADYYRAICELERERGFAPGSLLYTSYRQLGDLAGRTPRHAGDNLAYLLEVGLLATFERGSGRGEHARDRLPSRIQRAVPIPSAPTHLPPQYKTGAVAAPWIGDSPSPEINDERAPDIDDLRRTTQTGEAE